MFSNKRRRLVGILLAIAVPAVIGAIAMPANALTTGDEVPCTSGPNLVANCGFEASVASSTSPIPHWTHISGGGGFISSSYHHSGGHSLGLQSTSADDFYTQTISVKPHTQYVVAAWINAVTNSGPPSNDFTLAATNIQGSPDATTIYSSSNLSQGWRPIGGYVTTTSATTMTLVIHGANGPNATYVDDVRVLPQRSGCAAIANNLVQDCGFENTSSDDPWVVDVDHGIGTTTYVANGGSRSLYLNSTSYDGQWHQVLPVRPHTKYTLSFWVEYDVNGATSPVDDLHVRVSNVPASSGGVLAINSSNITDRFWAQVTKTFTTGNGSTATLTVSGANVPASTYVDDFSVTAVPSLHDSASGRTITTTLHGLGGQKVTLQKLVNKRWTNVHSWTAPKTGYSKSFAFKVGSGGSYRSVSGSAPGYGSATSNTVSVH
ncbi:MAG: carbohydrate binding domain-containing protein [Marmoricola sp.]